MAIDEIEKAYSLMEKTGEEILLTGFVSDEIITAAETLLEVKFPDDYKHFLRKYGALSFEAEEFYGITKSGLEGKSVPCAIFSTKSARLRGDISKDMIKIKSSGYGPSFSIDTSQVDKNGCAVIVETDLSFKSNGDKKIAANNFSEFFLSEIQNAIEDL